LVIEIVPAQVQKHLESDPSAETSPTITVGIPGVQGATMFGMHGCGVSTPDAAAVAAATCGLAVLEHMPNGMTFAMGTWSVMTATGVPDWTLWVGGTMREDGVVPNVHCSVAPITTS
jgi:hypothetical protein